jgi:hypothetical protein
MGGTNLIKRLTRWLRKDDELDVLRLAVAEVAIELMRTRIDLEYAKAVLYSIATDPHVNSRDDMIDLAFDTWLDLDGQ